MINLDNINPQNGSKYSPNLYKWLSNRRETARKTFGVYSLKGELYIGHIRRNGEFIGARLSSVMRIGNKADFGTFGLLAITRVSDFWQNYERLGRCIFDPEHRKSFIGDEDRWQKGEMSRSCSWCGECVQGLHRWEEVVERSEWRNKVD